MEHSNRAHSRTSLFMGCGVQTAAEGCHVEDHGGNRFLDFFDAYGNQSFGYAHPEILQAIRQQIDRKHTNNCKVFFEALASELGVALAQLTDHELPFSFLTNGGAEAVEAAIKLARGVTRRPKFITARNAYHGKTFAALSAAARPEYIELYQPMMPDFVPVPFGDLAALEQTIDAQTAAVLMEPVQCEGGINVPPAGYFQKVRQLCDRHGALLVLDETQTGFGRTGTFFAFQNFGVTPDIVIIGKSFGGGMLPVAAIMARKTCWEPIRLSPLSFGSSLGGAPLSSAVGLKTVEMASRPDFLQSIRRRGERVADALQSLQRDYPRLIRATRGLGLLHAIELFDPSVVGLILWLLYRRRLMTAFCLFNPLVLRVQPPLIVSDADLETGLSLIRDAFAEAKDYLAEHHPGPARESRLQVSWNFPVAPERLFAFLAENHYVAGFSPFVRSFRPLAQGGIHCDGDLEGIALEWEETIDVDPAAAIIREKITNGDWSEFDRTWEVRPVEGDPARSELRLTVAWNAGTGDFEKVLVLRLHYSLRNELNLIAKRLQEKLAPEGLPTLIA